MNDPDGLLDPEQLHKTEYIAEHSMLEKLRRRARLLLAYHQGQKTISAASQVGLSPGRVRFWRHQFQLRGMDIFPPAELNRVAAETPGDIPIQETQDQPLEAFEPVPEHAALTFPAPMSAPGVAALDTIAEAGRKVMLYQFAEMLSHEDGTRQGVDTEELHDMRVATRRMRAAFNVFEQAYAPKAIRSALKGLKATGSALGRVRDMDVFIQKARLYQNSLPEAQQPGLEPLLVSWIQEREMDRAKLLDHMNSSAYQKFKRTFNVFLQTPGAGLKSEADHPEPQPLVRDFAPVLIYNRLAAVRAYETILGSATLDQLHALRIEFKKLRYAVEFFEEVLGKPADEVIDVLKVVQDHLGNLNDARVAIQMITQFLESWESRQALLPLAERQSPEPVVAFLAAKHAERYHLMVTFPRTWTRFNQPELRHNLALAIASL